MSKRVSYRLGASNDLGSGSVRDGLRVELDPTVLRSGLGAVEGLELLDRPPVGITALERPDVVLLALLDLRDGGDVLLPGRNRPTRALLDL